jgi:hypothetical protein
VKGRPVLVEPSLQRARGFALDFWTSVYQLIEA